jgi:protocatechuate 3,4-dioxygenase beta subunit
MSIENKNKSRRQFLRNTALTAVSLGLLPEIANSSSKHQAEISGGCIPTTRDFFGQGPFYTANAPEMIDNQMAASNEPGTRLILSGIITTLDCADAIPNTLIDAWHANDAGAYDNVGYNLRGITYTNAQGFYVIETILPGKYLNGASFRPRHIHFRITAPGYPTFITQLYFEGDTDIPGDAAASITSGTFNATNRIIPITLNNQGKYEGTWNIAIDGNGSVGVADVHLDKGVIYSATPNPFIDLVEINYGVYQTSKVSIQVFDMRGTLVAVLNEENLQPQKYHATWHPNAELQSGIYFIVLKINDLQVNYLKIVKI